MKERLFIYVTEKGKEALEKIYAFNEGKLKKRDIASDLLIAEAKKYKGRKPKIRKWGRWPFKKIEFVFLEKKDFCCDCNIKQLYRHARRLFIVAIHGAQNSKAKS